MNLPKDYQSKMQEMLGEEYLQYLDSFNPVSYTHLTLPTT